MKQLILFKKGSLKALGVALLKLVMILKKGLLVALKSVTAAIVKFSAKLLLTPIG